MAELTKTEKIVFIFLVLSHPSFDERGVHYERLGYLPRRLPGEVGDVVNVTYRDNRVQKVVTRSVHPPIFELPDFLSTAECDEMVGLAKKKGIQKAQTIDGKTSKYRKGKTAFIRAHTAPLLRTIQNRAISLTGLSKNIVYNSESVQFGMYEAGGYYNFHYDSGARPRHEAMETPCCHHILPPHSQDRCTLCRYVTILMYLNDVDEGGSTAFPLADKPVQRIYEKHVDVDYLHLNCVEAPVVVQPRKGNAVMWYNNIIDPKKGWIGEYDEGSLHGGCPILKGEKWISNLWINAPQYHSKHKKSVYHNYE